MMVFVCVPKPGRKCYAGSLYLKFFNILQFIFISEYATSALALANIITEIFITAQRLALVTRTPFCIKKVKVKTVCLIILAGSFLAHGPLLFMNKIQSVRDFNKTVDYRLAKTDFGKHSMGRATVIILTGTRIILVTIVLFVLSIISVIKFHRFYKQKKGGEFKSITCNFMLVNLLRHFFKFHKINNILQTSQSFPIPIRVR
jgi:hypothetical protein